jgi:hypothetical protein
MKTRSIILCLILTSGFLIGALLFDNHQQAFSQMGMGKMNATMMNRTGMMDMMNSRMMMSPNMMNMMNPNGMGMGMGMFTNENITSSIKLLPAMMNGIHSQMKVSLGDAVTTAQKELGNNSQAVFAHVGVESEYLVYTIWGIDPDMNLHKVIIDPGNGKVLLSQIMSMMPMMNPNMNPMMGGGMMNPMMGGGMMNPMMGGGMMNPMMGGGMMNPMMSHMGH